MASGVGQAASSLQGRISTSAGMPQASCSLRAISRVMARLRLRISEARDFEASALQRVVFAVFGADAERAFSDAL